MSVKWEWTKQNNIEMKEGEVGVEDMWQMDTYVIVAVVDIIVEVEVDLNGVIGNNVKGTV